MSEPPRKKKKGGGSFCSMGGCSNRSSRNTTSSHPGRDFLRYLRPPQDAQERKKWMTRMKRDIKSWTIGNNTRICSDHFFETDFEEEDLERYRSRLGTDDKVTHIRLKPNSLPNTDRTTGRFADPLTGENRYRRMPPKERCPEQILS